MKLTSCVQDDVTVVAIAGEFDANTVGRFRGVVDDALAAQRRDFVVNLVDMTRVDSAGLEAFTALHREAEEQLGMVRFCGADETIRKVFEITRLDKQLALHEDVGEALRSFAQA